MNVSGLLVEAGGFLEALQESAKEPLIYCHLVAMILLAALAFMSLALVSGLEYLDDDENSWGPSHGSELFVALGSGSIGVLLVLSLFFLG